MSSLWPIYYRIYEKFIRNDVIFSQIFKDHGLLGGVSVMLQIKMDFCVALISYKLGCPKGGVHVEEA